MVRTQPFCETTTVIGSRSTKASSMAAKSCSGASANSVRRLPSGVFGPRLPISRPPHQHVTPMIDPLAQDLGQSADLGHASLDQNVHVDRDSAFQLREPEQ